MIAETITLQGHNGDTINAYFARLLGAGPFPAMVMVHHLPGFDAVLDLWGGRVVMGPEELTDKQPVAPLDYTAGLSCPLLGLFGEEDRSPSPAQVARHEEELRRLGKQYEFHMYAGAGHGFFYHNRPAYRQEQAVDGWDKIWRFLEKHMAA